MNQYLQVLLLAALPAVGNFSGGVLAEFIPVSRRVLSYALHASGGIVVAVVGVELMPTALEGERDWIVLLFFVLGGLFTVLLDKTFDIMSTRFGNGQTKKGVWSIYAGVSTDLFTDGLMIGTASVISTEVGLLLALGQVAGDFPEGFASIATFKRQGYARAKRLALSASFALPILIGATVGFWFFRGAAPVAQYSALSFAAAILVVTAVEEMVGEAHGEIEDARWEGFVFACGFALFAAVSVYLGSQ